MIPYHVLESEQWVPRPLEEVFEFFSNARNLELLTPPWVKFRVLTMPIAMEAGARIRYKIGWHGLPMRWTTEITEWNPPDGFRDLQLSGPYKLWDHTHRFGAVDGGTLLHDLVKYSLPLGFLGRIAHSLWVKKDVERIFSYRRERIREMFGG